MPSEVKRETCEYEGTDMRSKEFEMCKERRMGGRRRGGCNHHFQKGVVERLSLKHLMI